MANPMEQFEIKNIIPIQYGEYDLSFTNSSLWMTLALLSVSIFLFIGTAKPQLVPGRWQASVEYLYDFVRKMLDDNVGLEGRKFAPLIFSLFIFVLACNMLGMIPWVGSFTSTSHISVTLGLAMLVFIIVCVVGFWKHGFHFFSLFWPKDTFFPLAVFVACIEFLSFLSRPFTLAIRLFANMTAGHVLLKVFGTFVVSLGLFSDLPFVLGLLPLSVTIALTGLEVLIAVVQAYVFALLASIYLNDAINLH